MDRLELLNNIGKEVWTRDKYDHTSKIFRGKIREELFVMDGENRHFAQLLEHPLGNVLRFGYYTWTTDGRLILGSQTGPIWTPDIYSTIHGGILAQKWL